MAKVYKIAKNVSIASKGIILDEGTEVTAGDFASETVFNQLVKAKKIVKDGEKEDRKGNNKPTSSSTETTKPSTETTKPSTETTESSVKNTQPNESK